MKGILLPEVEGPSSASSRADSELGSKDKVPGLEDGIAASVSGLACWLIDLSTPSSAQLGSKARVVARANKCRHSCTRTRVAQAYQVHKQFGVLTGAAPSSYLDRFCL